MISNNTHQYIGKVIFLQSKGMGDVFIALLDKSIINSASYEKKNKSSSRCAQVLPIGIPAVSQNNFSKNQFNLRCILPFLFGS